MTERWSGQSTTDQVLQGVNLAGKRVLVTGVSAGLGIETARALVAHGASVVGTARSLEKAHAATDVVRASATSPEQFRIVEMDLASLASTRACAERLIDRGEAFDVIIANAGVMACPQGVTEDGFETQFGTNYLGHFLLINRIASLLAVGGRVVVVSSAGHRFTDVDIDDPGFERSSYDPFIAYGRSKTANILFAVEFDRRHRDAGRRAVAVHPGAIDTELSRHMTPEVRQRLLSSIDAKNAAEGRPPLRRKSIAEGAATTVWAGFVAPSDDVGGRYCEDCHVSVIADDEGVRSGVRSYAVDPDRAGALWAKSEAMIGESF